MIMKTGIWETKTKTGVLTYKHSCFYIDDLLYHNNFETVSALRFPAFSNQELQKDFYFTCVAALLNQNH